MLEPFLFAALEMLKLIKQIVSGRLLLDDEIVAVSKKIGGSVGEWLGGLKEEDEATNRVEGARRHITEASRLMSGLQDDLNNQARQLQQLIADVEEKKKLANHYGVLAQVREEALAAFKAEMEESVRNELTVQAQTGRRGRQVMSVVTLVLGAALGAYFPKIVALVAVAWGS